MAKKDKAKAKKSKTGSQNPAYPDAHPTAPGGMSQPALIAEMVSKHGWDESEAEAMRWPDQIKAVVQGRLDREAEAREETARIDAALAESRAAVAQAEAERKAASLLIADPDSYDYVFNGHAGAGPSAASRWMTCTASLRDTRTFLETLSLEQQKVFGSSSEAARQGTTAHAAAEAEANLLLGRITKGEYEQTLLELSTLPDAGEEYTDEMGDYVSEYVDLVRDYATERGDAAVAIESRVSAIVPLPALTPTGDEWYAIEGTADLSVKPVPGHDDLVVGDLKYGIGVEVSPVENPQLRIYGLGVLGEVADEEGNLPDGLERVTYIIAQPRAGGISTWSETVYDLLEWRDEVLAPAVMAALYDHPDYPAVYNPSDEACGFCPVQGQCAALGEKRLRDAAELFQIVTETEVANGMGSHPETGPLSNERLGSLLAQADGLVSLRDHLKAEVNRRLLAGEEVPGYKLVSYTPKRGWKPEAAEALAEVDAVWKRTLISPKQALAALGDEADSLADLIDTPDKRPVTAPEGDNRADWQPKTAAEMFSEE